MFGDFRNDRPLGYQQFACAVSTALPSVPAAASIALITTEAQAIRWRDDGIAPTATVGYPLAAGSELEYSGQLSQFRCIEQTGGASVSVSYYGFPL